MSTAAAIKIIKPQSERSFAEDVASIWTHSELLLVLARREISVRYRQTAVGLLWVLLQPLVTTAIFTTVFVFFIRIPDQGGESYPLFAFAGIAVWQYFTRIVTDGGGSLVSNSALITKVSFPRLIIPLVAPIAAGLDCLIAIIALVLLTAAFGAHLSWTVVFAPFVIICCGAVRLCRRAVACPTQRDLSRHRHRYALRDPDRRCISARSFIRPRWFLKKSDGYMNSIRSPSWSTRCAGRFLEPTRPRLPASACSPWLRCCCSGVERGGSGAWREILLTGFDWPVRLAELDCGTCIIGSDQAYDCGD